MVERQSFEPPAKDDLSGSGRKCPAARGGFTPRDTVVSRPAWIFRSRHRRQELLAICTGDEIRRPRGPPCPVGRDSYRPSMGQTVTPTLDSPSTWRGCPSWCLVLRPR